MRRTVVSLIGMTLLSLAITKIPAGFAQDAQPTGIFQLNLTKSKFPGAPLKSQTIYFEGQKATTVGIDAQGNARAVVFEVVEDGKPHPVTGFPAYNASTYTRVDAHTVNFTRLKDEKVVQTGTTVLSSDGKTWTATLINAANGQNIIQVYEKP
jgi:hypothetical protein